MSTVNSDRVQVIATNADGEVVFGVGGSRPTTAGVYSIGCILVVGGTIYYNTGTVDSPSFNDINSISSAEIADSAVTLAKLASGVTPSHVAKYSGKITWSGSGASLATTVTGVAATDVVIATIQTAPTQAAYIVSAAPTTNTITLTLSAANTSNDAVIAYQVLRVAA